MDFDFDKIKFLLLSYPRSGNTWTRYIFEAISKRSSIGYSVGHPADRAIGSRLRLDVDFDQPAILKKSHCLNQQERKSDKSLILIIRNYKEAITRHLTDDRVPAIKNPVERFKLHLTGNDAFDHIDYIYPIIAFDNWKHNKHLIYYEDLIAHPQRTIHDLSNFCGFSTEDTDFFLANLKKHRESGCKIYSAKSYTKGKKTKFHLHRISKTNRKLIDQHIKDNFSDIFNKYLKQYAENTD